MNCHQLVACRTALGMKRSQLAAALFLTRNSIYRKENPAYAVAITPRDVAGIRALLEAAIKAPKKHPAANPELCAAALESIKNG